jgi:hypothetical protein
MEEGKEGMEEGWRGEGKRKDRRERERKQGEEGGD